MSVSAVDYRQDLLVNLAEVLAFCRVICSGLFKVDAVDLLAELYVVIVLPILRSRRVGDHQSYETKDPQPRKLLAGEKVACFRPVHSS